jgi:hypothetical protein
MYDKVYKKVDKIEKTFDVADLTKTWSLNLLGS